MLNSVQFQDREHLAPTIELPEGEDALRRSRHLSWEVLWNTRWGQGMVLNLAEKNFAVSTPEGS